MRDSTAIALMLALLGPLVTYLIAARQFSGKIKNSDASELWEESRAIREWSSLQIKRLEERIEELETSNRALLEQNLQYAELLEIERAANATLKEQRGDPK